MNKRSGFRKEYSSTREIWSEYWNKQNERNKRKPLTNKRKSFII